MNYFRESAAALLEYKKYKGRSKNLRYLAFNIAKLFKGIRVSRRDLQQRPGTPIIRAKDDQAQYSILDLQHQGELSLLRDHCSDIRCQYIEEVKKGDIVDITKWQNEYDKHLQLYREACKNIFFRKKGIVVNLAKVGVAPSMGLAASLAKQYNPELGHILIDLIPHSYDEIQLLIDAFLPMELDEFDRVKYPILAYDYIPTFHLWNLPALPPADI